MWHAACQGMEGAAVGIWCAHGEGRAKFPDPAIQRAVLDAGLAPIRCRSLPTLPQCTHACMAFPAPAVHNNSRLG